MANNPISEGYRIMWEWFIREIIGKGKEISQNIPPEIPKKEVEGDFHSSDKSE